jgi:hypothetical protein
MRRHLSFAFLFASLLVNGAEAQQAQEYQVKAAIVLNFANFVEWPATAFRRPHDAFAICVFGHDPFGTALTSLSEGKTVDGRPFSVSDVTDVAQLSGCQIVFVSASERLRFRAILATLKTSSTLTVGDTADFIAEGGLITLRVDNGKIRMQINAQAARERSLRINSHLLSLAERAR